MSNEKTEQPSAPGPRDSIYQISTNRRTARHRVRYVESSAPTDGDCRLCVGTLSDKAEDPKPEDSKQNSTDS